MPAEILTAFGESLADLINQKIEQKALKVGDSAPQLSVMINGQTIALADLLQNGAVVVNFFRGNWCPFCMAELKAYQAQLAESDLPLNQFLFISPQSASFNQSLVTEHGINLQLISDSHNAIARQFGLVFQLQENIRAIYKAIGADLPAFNGDESFELPIPATYIIDPTGKITYAFVEPNYMLRAGVDEVVANL